MDLIKTGFKFFRIAADQDCPITPDGAKRLCNAVEEIKKEQWRIKLVIFYIAGFLTMSEGDKFLQFALRIFGF